MTVTLADITAERIRREMARRQAKKGLLAFTQHTMPAYETNWHHEVLASALDRWIAKPGAKLIVCMPPRHGKSELVSRRLPAYIFGLLPDAKVIAASYGQTLANSMSNDVKSIMHEQSFTGLFPRSRLPYSGAVRRINRIDDWELMYRSGRYKGVGVGSGVTGFGFDFGIVDDPIKDDAEAQSPRVREKIWYWYHSTFRTRRQPGARELITMTRWHQNDLVGRMLATENDWEVIELPAVKEESDTVPEDTRTVGDFLWPSRFGPDQLESVKAVERVWNAAYRQKPSDGEGNVYKKGMFPRYTELPVEGFSEYVLSIDASFKDLSTSSRVSMILVARQRDKERYFVLDEENDQMGFLETLDRAKRIIARWPEAAGSLTVLVEDKANGSAIIDVMSKALPNVVSTSPRESKLARARSVLPIYRALNVVFPAETFMVRGEVPAQWSREMIDELIEFPYHAFNDRVDAMSQVLRYYAENAWDVLFGRIDAEEDDDIELMIGGEHEDDGWPRF